MKLHKLTTDEAKHEAAREPRETGPRRAPTAAQRAYVLALLLAVARQARLAREASHAAD